MYNFFHISNKYMYVGLGPLINRKKREKNQSQLEDFSTVTPLAYFHNHRCSTVDDFYRFFNTITGTCSIDMTDTESHAKEPLTLRP